MTSGLACEEVRLAVDGPVAVVTVGTGRRRNALTTQGWRHLEIAVRRLADAPGTRAAVVRGTADTFCAGSDMTEWSDADPAAVEESFARMEMAFVAIEEAPVPFVAEIAGVAAGAGCQLALACDLRVMADSARLGMPIARLGILPSPAFAARMARAAGPALARELLYTGRLVDARTAVATGLANAAVPDGALAGHVRRLVADIARQPEAAVRAAKRAVATATGAVPTASLGPAVSYDDFRRGVAAFLGSGPVRNPAPG